MVKVVIGGDEATIDGYVWISDSLQLATLLNSLLDIDGPSGADPNSDLTIAQLAISTFGGEILTQDDAPFDENLVY